MSGRAYRPRRASKRWLEGAPEYVLDCFDNRGKTIDRYTVLFGGTLLVPTHALRKRGRKHFHLVIIGHPIYVLKVLIDKSDGITPLVQDLGGVVAKFLAAAERCGITEGARAILEEAKSGH